LTPEAMANDEHDKNRIWNDITSRVEFLSDQLPQLSPRLISDTRSE